MRLRWSASRSRRAHSAADTAAGRQPVCQSLPWWMVVCVKRPGRAAVPGREPGRKGLREKRLRARRSAPEKFAKFDLPAGTTFFVEHYPCVTAETPPPVQAAGDTIPKASVPPRAEAFFGTRQEPPGPSPNPGSRGPAGKGRQWRLPPHRSQRLQIDPVSLVDVAVDRIGNRDHSLIVVQNPADLAAAGAILRHRIAPDIFDHHEGQLARQPR